MESRLILILLVSMALSACQSAEVLENGEFIDPSAYTLETVLPDEGGSECHLIEVATEEELESFFVDGIRGEEACRIIGFLDRTVFAQVTPDDFDGGGGFYY